MTVGCATGSGMAYGINGRSLEESGILMRLGISKWQAYAWSRTRMGGWAVAQSPILRTTITLKRLRIRGYQSLLEHYTLVTPLLNEPLSAVYENRTYGGVPRREAMPRGALAVI